MFHVPKQDDVNREGFSLPDPDRYDVTLTGVEATRSKKGDPMMVFTETIDNGPNAGHTLKEYFAFSDSNNIAWSRLANICDMAGFEWEEASSLEAFAAQFPVNKLRWSVEVEHSYSVKAYLDVNNRYKYESKVAMKDADHPYEQWVNVEEEEYEEWPTDDKNVRAQVMDTLDFRMVYGEVQKPRELPLGEEDTYQPSGDGAQQQPVPAGSDVTADDDLPF